MSSSTTPQETSAPARIAPAWSKPKIVVLDYRMGNRRSVAKALSHVGASVEVSGEERVIRQADGLVIIGVGAFPEAMRRIEPLRRVLAERHSESTPILGLCLGLQVLFEGSEEHGGARGLGLLGGEVRRLRSGDLKLPHIGWNTVHWEQESPLLEGLQDGAAFYHANSYAAVPSSAGDVLARTRYGESFVSAIQHGSLYGVQFHPEKSAGNGLRLLENFARICAGAGRTRDSRAAAARRGGALGGLGQAGSAGAGAVGASAVGSGAGGPGVGRAGSGAGGAGRRDAGGAGAGGAGGSGGGLRRRVIPCLDVDGGRVVKGTGFVDLKDAGDPVELAQRYGEQGADEVTFLDITATHENRGTIAELARRAVENVFVPITIGGGIRTVEDAQAVLDVGADNVSVNSAAVARPELLDELAEVFASQNVILAVDAKRRGGDPSEGWEVFVAGGRKPTGLDAVAWAAEGAQRGAGQILLTSMDRDGTGEGYDTALIAAVAEAARIPVIASGGAGELSDLTRAIGAGADAVLCASVFHYGRYTVGDVKEHLAADGIEVTPPIPPWRAGNTGNGGSE